MFKTYPASDMNIFILTGGCALIGVTVLYRTITTTLRKLIVQETTVLLDIPKAGIPRSGERIKGTAVICGGSIAGLFAARVCADHFEDVLIVEPENWLATDGRISQYDEEGKEKVGFQHHKRTRLIQYDQPHAVYPIYLSILRQLNPEADDEFRKASARVAPAWQEILYKGKSINLTFPHRYPKGNPPLTIYSSRPCVETVTRKLLYEPGGRIRWMAGTVIDFGSPVLGKEIDHITVRSSDDTMKVPAALVVDCSGLTRLGAKVFKRSLSSNKDEALFDKITETFVGLLDMHCFRYVVKPEMRDRLPIPGGYDNATVIYSWIGLGSGENKSITSAYLDGHRIEIRCYVIGGLKDHRDIIPWAQTLEGHRPVDAWFLEMIKILQEDEPEEEVRYHAHPFYCIHYENMPNLPSNFVACGDSLMHLNPRGGQGLSKAAMDALTLDRVLRKLPPSFNPRIDETFGKRFFQLLAKRTGSIWESLKTFTYGIAGTIPVKGETLEKGAFGRELGHLVMQLIAEGDEQVGFAYWSVRVFLAPRIDMLHPMILLKALMLKIRIKLGISKSINLGDG